MFFFSSRRRHTRYWRDWSSDVCSSDLVGREDGKALALSYRFLRALEHRIQLFNLRRTHVLPHNEADLRRLGRSLGYADPASELLTTWRHTAQVVRRLHERLFYSPLLDAVARSEEHTSELQSR